MSRQESLGELTAKMKAGMVARHFGPWVLVYQHLLFAAGPEVAERFLDNRLARDTRPEGPRRFFNEATYRKDEDGLKG